MASAETKLEEVYKKIRTLYQQIGEARTRACDREVDNNLRHVADALQLEFPEAFFKTPEVPPGFSPAANALFQDQVAARVEEAMLGPTREVWAEFLKVAQIYFEQEYDKALRLYKEGGFVAPLAHAILNRYVCREMMKEQERDVPWEPRWFCRGCPTKGNPARNLERCDICRDRPGYGDVLKG